MNELERYLDRVCRTLRGSRSLRRHVREELREHLLEAIERHEARGADHEQAIAKAIEEFGEPEMVREGLQAVYGRPVMAMLIEKAMAWKEKTMKTGWKWSFVAHLDLAMIFAALVFFVFVVHVFITPKLYDEYMELQVSLPAYAESVIRFTIRFCGTWFIWMPLIAIGWVAFELRCHSENKSAIRLATGGLACLGMTALVFLVSVATVVPLAELPGLMRQQQRERNILQRFAGAGETVQKLGVELEQNDWASARESQRALDRTFRFLDRIGTAEAALAPADSLEGLKETRRLIEDVDRATGTIGQNLRILLLRKDDAVQARMLGAFSRLKESYDRLADNVQARPAPRASTQPRFRFSPADPGRFPPPPR
jgi:hypothetical protein